MKKFIALALLSLLSAPSAFADEAGAGQAVKAEKFADHKAQILQHMDEARNCVQSAADREAMKACHERARQDRKARHGDRKPGGDKL